MSSNNSIGKIFTFNTWGESHGKAIGCVVDGVPSNISLNEKDIQPYLDKRRPGQSKFTTQRKEPDSVRIMSGVFEGSTTGTPIALHIDNVDARSKDYSDIADKYRPGHAERGLVQPASKPQQLLQLAPCWPISGHAIPRGIHRECTN